MSSVANSSRPRFHGARILLADDSPINQAVTRSMLKHLGCARIDVVDDGGAAVDRASRESYDLILMDCRMPVMDGYQAARVIRERETTGPGRVPIVAVSGQVLAGDRERCLEHGMDDFLSKPFQLSGLRALLERWLGVGALVDEPERQVA
jgi:two-component system, sensor histidine kinase